MLEKLLLAFGLTLSLSLFTGLNLSNPKQTGNINLNSQQAFNYTQVFSNISY
ncbi:MULTISPECIES: hypothetical protein [Calothrix]|uniref:Uncharacterized protein n=2 Tax=Calothrix TaxID=1186 RepID=A0ABR8A969_9CYAN|nr:MULTISPECIES: hypothetical protein [Calothrix]MBD2196456.1 hypothetical protein [Calothrix parietina FACHB-288]MBD2224649.1 hypothetical protein [Calothrix anomala FACHB-343]